MTTVPARWTDDCQGKKDYDGKLVTLSTRYWPRGGSSDVFQDGRFVSDRHSPERQHIRPSASSQIYLHVGPVDEEGSRKSLTMATQEFEGDSEADVKAQVETWAQTQYDRIARAVRQEFGR